MQIQKEIKVKIPRGSDTGELIKVEGEGEPGDVGGTSGDLYILL
jgi:molecular chaperone DnaJ